MKMHTLRSARADDLDHIMTLEAKGFASPICESRAVMQTRLQHFPEGFLVLDDGGGTPIGYFCSELWDDNAGMDEAAFAVGHDIRDVHRHDGRRLYISSMTIDPAHRGNGFGGHFFRQCVGLLRQRMPQIEHSTLMLSAEWTGAHRIYQQYGYVETKRLAQFFSLIAERDADAIVMHKDFC